MQASKILREGGNAVDAAVATGFALAVVHPIAGNLGGGGFLLLRTHDGRATFIDFREKAPLAATENMYLDAHGNVIPDASVIGYRSIATPGSVAGLAYAERKYGRLDLKRVMAPAIKLAAQGFELTAEEAHELSDPDLAQFPESKRIFQRDGHLYKAAKPSSSRNWRAPWSASPPIPTTSTTARWRMSWWTSSRRAARCLPSTTWHNTRWWSARPIVGTFHDYTILSAPPPSSGGIVLVSALNILEGYDLRQARRPHRRPRFT